MLFKGDIIIKYCPVDEIAAPAQNLVEYNIFLFQVCPKL